MKFLGRVGVPIGTRNNQLHFGTYLDLKSRVSESGLYFAVWNVKCLEVTDRERVYVEQ